MSGLKTRWTDSVDKSCPLNEYPRPQLKRDDWLCLNGEWDYAVTPFGQDCPDSFTEKITVPFAIESLLSGVQRTFRPDERLWYRRYFYIPENLKDKRCIMHFEAVDWQCEIFVNRKSVGKHTGGYCPFEFDITDYLNENGNEIIVKVYDPTDTGWQQRGKQVLKSKGFWYTATSGIWQSVWMEFVNERHITKLHMTPDIDKGRLHLECVGTGITHCKVIARVLENEKEIFNGEVPLVGFIDVDNAHLWSPEDPFLYTLYLDVYNDDVLVDNVESYFGMRKFSVDKDDKGVPRLMLNNKPYFMRGLLDQGYWPDGGLTPPCDEAMIFDIQKMKDLGFNMLRKHIKTENLRWYYHCDRLGMIVWQDMISGGDYIGNILAGVLPNLNIPVDDKHYTWFKRTEDEWRDDYERELLEVIDNLYNCVSIGCWVPFNEGWGQFDAKRIAEKVKEIDSSRFVDHASGWYDQKGGDFKSEHRYILPVYRPKDKKLNRPFVLSEYGGYSQIIDSHVWNKPKSFGYVMYNSKDKLSKAYKKLHEKQVIPLIEKGLCATVYTQVSDVEFEVNGMYTYDREILKLDPQTVKEVNSLLTY